MMDQPLAAAAAALAHGDPLAALKHVALRHDAQAVALRATALAQLGEYGDAKALFKRAAKGFSQAHAVARARCTVALAEIALASRELNVADAGLARAIAVLAQHGDQVNARYAQLVHARYALALGKVDLARQRLDAIDARDAMPALRALLALALAEVALRRMRPEDAKKALTAARQAAMRAQIPALIAEVQDAATALTRPVAKLVRSDCVALLTLADVRALLTGPQLVVDGCRRSVQQGAVRVTFATRPVLFALLRRLAEASPAEVGRDELIRVGFGIQRPSDALRARLRVAMGRLRKQLEALADLRATARGFVLLPHAPPVQVVLPPVDDDASRLLALVSDGEAWSSSALALALGESQRSVQRALGTLENAGKVTSHGQGKNRRWLAPPIHSFATHMLLPATSQDA